LGFQALRLLLDEVHVEGRVVFQHLSVICPNQLWVGSQGLQEELCRLGILDGPGGQRLQTPLVVRVVLDEGEKVGKVRAAEVHEVDEIVNEDLAISVLV
jgi:hypothetical protein